MTNHEMAMKLIYDAMDREQYFDTEPSDVMETVNEVERELDHLKSDSCLYALLKSNMEDLEVNPTIWDNFFYGKECD